MIYGTSSEDNDGSEISSSYCDWDLETKRRRISSDSSTCLTGNQSNVESDRDERPLDSSDTVISFGNQNDLNIMNSCEISCSNNNNRCQNDDIEILSEIFEEEYEGYYLQEKCKYECSRTKPWYFYVVDNDSF